MAAFGRRNARTQNRRAPENYDHQVRAVSIPIRLLLWTRLASLSRVFTSISCQGIQTRFVVPSSDPSGLLSHQVLQTHFAVAGLPARSLPRFSVSAPSERLDSTLCLSLPARLPAGAFRAAPDGHARVKSTNRRRTAFPRSNRRPRPHKKYLGALFRPYFGTYNDPRHFSSPYHRKPIAPTPPQRCVRGFPADTPFTATSSRLVASWPADSFQRRTKLGARTTATCQFAALSPLGWVAAPWRRLSTPAVRPSIDSGSATATTSCGSSAPAS